MTAPPRLWAITPPSGTPSAAKFDVWRAAADGEPVGLWLRTPGAAPGEVLARCTELVAAARRAGIPTVIGAAIEELDAAAIAIARHGLRGVVLRADPDAVALRHARAKLGPLAWIGRSTHGSSGDHDACTFTVLAPVHTPHTSKPVATHPLGLAGLAAAAAAPGARIVALGGVDRRTAAGCVAAGAWGLAGIRSFFGPDDEVAEDVATLRWALRTATHGPTIP